MSCYDLQNTNDICSAHALLVLSGLARDCYDDLYRVALAAVMARRLASRKPHGYFAKILRDGFTKFGPADLDFAAAKTVMQELGA